jgi:hypothetical protein
VNALAIITGKLKSAKRSPVILSWDDAETIKAALQASVPDNGRWRSIDTAPCDKTPVLIRTYMGFAFPAFYDPNSSLDSAMNSCGQWVAVHEGFHPPCWSEGACWTSNAEEVSSDPPVAWKPLTE